MLAAFLRNDNNLGLAAVAVLRWLVISGILIMVLPVTCGANSLWLAMPITEVLVMIYVIYSMKKCTHLLPVVEGKWKKHHWNISFIFRQTYFIYNKNS